MVYHQLCVCEVSTFVGRWRIQAPLSFLKCCVGVDDQTRVTFIFILKKIQIQQVIVGLYAAQNCRLGREVKVVGEFIPHRCGLVGEQTVAVRVEGEGHFFSLIFPRYHQFLGQRVQGKLLRIHSSSFPSIVPCNAFHTCSRLSVANLGN